MKITKKVSTKQVFAYWKKYDTNNNSIMRDKLSNPELKTTFYLAEIEKKDIKNINIIYAGDWLYNYDLAISKDHKKRDFSLENVTERYRLKRLKKDNPRVLQILSREISLREKECKAPILISRNEKTFTILEGNKRCVALNYMNSLVGQKIYLGIIKDDNYSFEWAARKSSTNGFLIHSELEKIKKPDFFYAWKKENTLELNPSNFTMEDSFFTLHDNDHGYDFIKYEILK